MVQFIPSSDKKSLFIIPDAPYNLILWGLIQEDTMPYIDCTDEVEINTPVSTVFNVVSNYPEWHTWIPIYRCFLIEGDAVKAGSKVNHQYGYKPLILSNFTRSIDKIIPNERLEESYIEGALSGKGIWEFSEAEGKTKASYRCMVHSKTLFTHLSFLLMGEKAHSNTYKPLLEKLKSHCESL